jgi:hypothetical protein
VEQRKHQFVSINLILIPTILFTEISNQEQNFVTAINNRFSAKTGIYNRKWFSFLKIVKNQNFCAARFHGKRRIQLAF